eukprot:14444639-Alexandrium_andersonii.AAC.1
MGLGCSGLDGPGAEQPPLGPVHGLQHSQLYGTHDGDGHHVPGHAHQLGAGERRREVQGRLAPAHQPPRRNRND